jgi:hypothetical protein
VDDATERVNRANKAARIAAAAAASNNNNNNNNNGFMGGSGKYKPILLSLKLA